MRQTNERSLGTQLASRAGPEWVRLRVGAEGAGFQKKTEALKSNSKRTCKLTLKQILVKNSGFSYSNSSFILPPKN
jgi:hypothetical protein